MAVDLEAQGVALHEDDVAAALVEEVLDRLDVGQGERPVAVTKGRDLERSVLAVGGLDDVDDGGCEVGRERVIPRDRLDHAPKL